MAIVILFTAVSLSIPTRAFAQENQVAVIDTLTNPTLFGTFVDAVSIAVDPLGTIYVLDRHRNTVSTYSSDFEPIEVSGGPGRKGGQFDGPSDIDPTTGFLLLIADTGNGRIQRLGTDFVFLESLSPNSTGYRVQDRLAANSYDSESSQAFDFMPIAVASSPDGRVFAVDSTKNEIRVWNSNRQMSGSSIVYAEWNPIDIVHDGSSLFVLDAASNEVLILDLFGNALQSIGTDLLDSPRSIRVIQGDIWVADSSRLLRFGRDGTLKKITSLSISEEIIDFDLVKNQVCVLTRRGAYRFDHS